MKLAAARIRRHRHEPARLQCRRCLTRIVELLADHERRLRQCRLGVPDAHPDGRDIVAFGGREQTRRPAGERIGDRDAGRQRLVHDVDERGGIARQVWVVADDECHGLADVTNHVARNGRLQIALGARRRRHTVGDDGRGQDIGGREHEPDAYDFTGALGVDRDEPRVGVWRADDDGVKHAGQPDVLDEAAPTGDEGFGAEARMRLADHGRVRGIIEARHGSAGRAERWGGVVPLRGRHVQSKMRS